MKIRIRRALTSNLGLKVLALFFAIVLWLVVVNVENPTRTKTFTAKVQVLNGSVLTDEGKYYTVKDDDYTISFRVTAKRSVMDKLTNDDFSATADMNYREDTRVPINLTAKQYASKVSISAQKYYLSITVGNMKSTSFVVEGKATGTPANGCTVGDITVSPETITVTGPEETVSAIRKAQAQINVDKASKDVSKTVVPIFYNKKGQKIDTTKLTLSTLSVKVKAKIKNTKTVPIDVKTSGTLANGLELGTITTDPTEIQLMGDADRLNTVAEITIPSSVIDLSTISQTTTTTVDISAYLPDGVSLAENESAQVKITVTLNTATTKTFAVLTSNLSVRNLTSGLKTSFDGQTVNVDITGLPSDLKTLDAGSITGYVDAQGLTEGSQSVPVTLNLDTTKFTIAPETVTLTISKK